jgi:ubiquinone/menaquinone biosynthesis C-methylase UbiE
LAGEKEDTMSTTTTPDYRAITERQQRVWSAGDFARVGTAHLLVGELLCESIDIHPRELVLDVAGGHGNTALAAARRWAEVTASDFVPHLLETAQRRAEVEHLPLTVRVADAQALPFEDGSFDVVLSTFGAMFAPDQQQTADELLRVCRSGGRIGMANWRADSLVGDIFRATSAHLPRRRVFALQSNGVTKPGSASSSATAAPRCGSRRATWSSATARRNTCSSTSAPGTARPTRPSRRSPTMRAQR